LLPSRNATGHGQTAEVILLNNEDPEVYFRLAESFFDKLKPNDELHLNARYEANHRNAFYRAFKGLAERRA